MNGSSGSSTTTVDKLPPEIESEYAMPYINRAKRLYKDKDHFDSYPYETYASQPDDEVDGITALADRGKLGDILITKADAYILPVLEGDYLPGTTSDFSTMLNNVINKPKKEIRNNVLNLIGGSLYYIGDNSGRNISRELFEDDDYYDRTANVLYAENYRNEKNRQDQTIPFAIDLGRQEVIDAETLRMAGLYQRVYNQEALTDAYKVYYEEQTAVVRKLDVYGNAIRAVMGTQTAIDRPYYRPSPIVGMLGGAMSGAAAGTMIAPGIGTAIGAIGGAILGGIGSS